VVRLFLRPERIFEPWVAPMIAGVAAAIVFLGVLVVTSLVVAGVFARSEARSMELRHRMGPTREAAPRAVLRDIDNVGASLGTIGHELHTLILRSGEQATVASLLGSSVVAGFCFAALAMWLLGPLWFVLGVFPAALPFYILQRRVDQRSKMITEQLPDALDLITRALRAGHAFTDALMMAGQEMPAPIGDELTHTAEEHRFGLPLRSCLQGLVDRLPNNFEVRFMISAVLLNRETGGNLVEVLETIAETVRERVVFESKVNALTAEVRMSALILQMLPFGAAALLIALEPDHLMPLFNTMLGRRLLMGGILSMLLGSIVMRRISQVEF
jgi:tight adherence protein B